MQQTEKYQLNLIERDDVFSPDALNENMEKVEQAITDEADALSQRVTMLEVHKFVVGTAPKGTFVDLGATPKAVIATMGGSSGAMLATTDSSNEFATIMEGGFEAGWRGNNFYYIAFL